MRVFFNGEFIPEKDALVPVTDRGWLYGDGLFDTMRLFEGKPFLWHQHNERLMQGAALMLIRIPYSKSDLAQVVGHLMELNDFYDGVLRIQISRAGNKRGYVPSNSTGVNMLINLHPLPSTETIGPDGLRLILSTQVVTAKSYFSSIKSANRLPQVMAAAEAEAADADDALLLNSEGQIASASAGNLFWEEEETVCTPPLESGCLPGVTREFLLKMCPKLDLTVSEKNVTPAELPTKSGISISNSIHGLRTAKSLLNQRLQSSSTVEKLAAAYDAALATGAMVDDAPEGN